MAHMLLAAGSDAHRLDAYRQSPLHLAVIGGDLTLVRTLVKLVGGGWVWFWL
jgi:ankyrin repeat protein